MANVLKFISTRSFFQLGAELKREKYDLKNEDTRQLRGAFYITFVILVWAVYTLIKYRRDLPGWIVILGIILLFIPAGPLLTLILVYYMLYMSKEEGEKEEISVVGEEGGARPRRLRSRDSPPVSSQGLLPASPPLVRRPGHYGTRGGRHDKPRLCPYHSRSPQ